MNHGSEIKPNRQAFIYYSFALRLLYLLAAAIVGSIAAKFFWGISYLVFAALFVLLNILSYYD